MKTDVEKAQLKTLADYRPQMAQCVKCGLCRAHCPVFAERGRETAVARGKITLAQALLDGDIGPDDKVAESLSQCLLCGTCSRHCPNQVPVDSMVLAARRELAAHRGRSLLSRSLAAVLRRPRLMQMLAFGVPRFAGLLFHRVPRQSGLRLRFSLPMVSRQRSLPAFARNSFRRSHAEYHPGNPDRPLVALFTGCMINFIYPQAGEGALRALTALGFNVVIPRDQGCCGLPALSAGDGATAGELAANNLRAFSLHNPAHIVALCASCHSGMTRYFCDLGPAYEKLSLRVTDIHTLLVDAGLEAVLQGLPRPATVPGAALHLPCHLRHDPQQAAAPGRLLDALTSTEWVPMDRSEACCGLGGTFSLYHYATSQRLGAIKAEAFRQSGADRLVTACPGCIMQLQDSLDQAGLPQRACHILELLGEALEDVQKLALPASSPTIRAEQKSNL